MTAKNSSNPGTTENEIVSTRVIAAPRARVFAAFSDPAQLARWWGPKGFTSTFSEFDFRPGGRWRLVLHGPDGASYPNEKEFAEIVPSERIAFWHLDPVHRFKMTMIFAEQAGRTALTWRICFDSAAEFAKVKDFIVVANEENLDRLETHLAAQP